MSLSRSLSSISMKLQWIYWSTVQSQFNVGWSDGDGQQSNQLDCMAKSGFQNIGKRRKSALK